MFIEAVIISIIIGLFRGGKLRRYKFVNHGTMWLLLLGMLIQYILISLNKTEEISGITKILVYTKQILIVSYILILIGIVTNHKFKGLWTASIGFLMNFLVMVLNGWKRPVLMEAIELIDPPELTEMIELGKSTLYTPIVENTKYPVLGDIIVFANPYPISRIISLGDIIISFGIFVLIQEIMLSEDSFMGGYKL